MAKATNPDDQATDHLQALERVLRQSAVISRLLVTTIPVAVALLAAVIAFGTYEIARRGSESESHRIIQENDRLRADVIMLRELVVEQSSVARKNEDEIDLLKKAVIGLTEQVALLNELVLGKENRP